MDLTGRCFLIPKDYIFNVSNLDQFIDKKVSFLPDGKIGVDGVVKGYTSITKVGDEYASIFSVRIPLIELLKYEVSAAKTNFRWERGTRNIR